MKIVAVSDTHAKHDKIIIPECDILIHSGDCTNKGSLLLFNEFCCWLGQQPASHKILVFGNHELGFSKDPKRKEALEICQQFGITLLHDSEIEIDGVKFFGQSWTPFFYDWEFNVPRGAQIAEKWKMIPSQTDVLITHGPPHGILDLVENDPWDDRDNHQGCEELIKKVESLDNLKLHVFGHLHRQGGNIANLNGKIFANAAICDDRHNPIHQPIIIEL